MRPNGTAHHISFNRNTLHLLLCTFFTNIKSWFYYCCNVPILFVCILLIFIYSAINRVISGKVNCGMLTLAILSTFSLYKGKSILEKENLQNLLNSNSKYFMFDVIFSTIYINICVLIGIYKKRFINVLNSERFRKRMENAKFCKESI